jgi:alkanesulfonate monooxygenase SsuD/methylene tetrahydromethanopterin reductase-like flavin-dependent oxidoreductase (luciferase family)
MYDHALRYGLLLPHFGPFASPRFLLRAADEAERYGFDSLWVRDHILFEPHWMEGEDRTFIEPFVAMTAVAGVTEKIALGTSALIPHRHPIYAAQLAASLSFLAGENRVIIGFGAGNFDFEFRAIELDHPYRPEVTREHALIMQKLWTEERVDWKSDLYRFENANVTPRPRTQIPIWYCGNTPASVRRAVEFCQGWAPGRITLNTLARRTRQLRQQAALAGVEVPTVSAHPITSIGRNRQDALQKVNLAGMLDEANHFKFWVKPPSGRFETVADLEGALLAGGAAEIIESTRQLQAAGLEHLVYDLRFNFHEWDECIRVLGEEVLPALREQSDAGLATPMSDPPES